jgi:hypothetical protein
MIEPCLEPWSAGEAARDAPIDFAATHPAQADTSAGGLSVAGDVCGWLAAYLGQYPKAVAVPRQVLRDIADKRWTDAGNGPVPLSRVRKLRRRVEGRSTSATKGRRSSKKLAAHLRTFEELGLIGRDNARDAIIITDPDGLRRLGDASPHAPGRAGR